MKLSNAQRKRYRENKIRSFCLATESMIIKFYKKHPDAEPDGSFVRAAWHQGYRSGRRSTVTAP
jgi:hypothetical protein